jgi:hypothetical protein
MQITLKDIPSFRLEVNGVTISGTKESLEVSVNQAAQKTLEAKKETEESSTATSAWHQTKFISTSPVCGSIISDAALVTMHNDMSVRWWVKGNLTPNGIPLPTGYMLGNPVLINGMIYAVGPTTDVNEWDIVQINLSTRAMGLIYKGVNENAVLGIASDGTNLWALTAANTIQQLDPTNYNLIQTFNLSLQSADIIMYTPGALIVGDVSGAVVVVDSSTGKLRGGISTGYNSAALSVVAPSQVAISSQWDREASVMMLDPETLEAYRSDLGEIPYNGVSAMIQIGGNYFTATPKGVGNYTIDPTTETLVFESMLLEDKNGGFLDVWNLCEVNDTTFFATGNDGIHRFSYSSAIPGQSMMHGTPDEKGRFAPLQRARRSKLIIKA